MWDHMWGSPYGPGWGAWGGWGLFGLMHAVWWILVVIAIVAIARWAIFGSRYRSRHEFEDRAQAILRERFARGEIDQAEFDEKMRHLKAR